jgi:ribosomal-protein-serine acetyltransferase
VQASRPPVEVRYWEESDAPAAADALTRSAAHLGRWLAWVHTERLDEATRRQWIRRVNGLRAAGEDIHFGIWRGEELVGGCGLHRRVGPGGLEIGYWVHADHLREGVATAAVRLLCERAFTMPSVDRVEIHHDRANVASEGVPRKLGFSLVGEAPEAPKVPAEEGIERVWRLTRAEWERRASAAR